MKTPLLALPLVLLLIQCHKDSPNPAKPEDQLPAATQTGANTFGCLVNGQPYTPKGNVGMTNFAVLYEPSPNGAGLNILTYRVELTNYAATNALSLYLLSYYCLSRTARLITSYVKLLTARCTQTGSK
jgi:hypothetical protein